MIENTNTKQFYPGPILNNTLEITDFLFNDAEQIKIKHSKLNEEGVLIDVDLDYSTDYEVTKILPSDVNAAEAALTASTGQVLLKNVNVLAGEKLTVYRVSQIIQDMDYPRTGAFPAASHEGALDYLTMQNQEQQEQINRSLKIPNSVETFDAQMPTPLPARALKINANGTGFEMSEFDPDVALITTEEFKNQAQQAAIEALASQNIATEQANIATEQATIATEQANIATEQATIATNKTSEVVISGNEALSNIGTAKSEALTEIETLHSSSVDDITNLKNTSISNITTAKNNAITSITNQETTSKNNIINEGATQVGLVQQEGINRVEEILETGCIDVDYTKETSTLTFTGGGNALLSNYYTKEETNDLIPTNNNQLVNGAGYITADYHDSTKQDVITDLATIRSGASKGATALQSVPSEYVTETELQNGLNTKQDKGDYALKSEIPTKTSQLTNDSNFITSSYHDSTKQDKLTAGDNITIVDNVISATGGGGGGSVNIVQTTGNSTTAVMSQKATTDMPAFKEVITPTKMLKAQNTQYCTSYDTFDYEDIKVAQVYCRQAYNDSINHYRTGDIRYTSAISLYKDSNNYLSIYFNGYRLAVRNRKGNVTINEVDLGGINTDATNINKAENPTWCAEINLQEKTCIFYVMRNGQLSPFGEVVDISTWDLSHLDTFNIVFGCSEYFGDSFCYYCLLNEKIEIDKIINTPIEYSKYNCYDTYLKNDIKPLQVTGIYADSTLSDSVAGTLIEEYDNFHKVFSFSIPASTGTSPYLGLYGQVQGTQHLGQICVIKCKFLEFAEGAGIRYASQSAYIYKGTEFVYLSTYGVPLFVPELNVEYTFVIRQEKTNPSGNYLLRGVGNFTMETLDMYFMTPQSANICAETWDGNFFRGVLPFVGTNVMFSNNYSSITTSRTGLGVPQYFQTTASNGNIYMYNGTTWKQISN